MESQQDRLARKIEAAKARALRERSTPLADGVRVGPDGRAYTQIPPPGSKKLCGCMWGFSCHKCYKP